MAKPTKAEAIQSFVGSLPNPGEIEPQPEQYWNQLRIWHERVLGERMQDAALVERRLKSLGRGFLQMLCLWIDLSPERTRVADLAEALKGKIAAEPSQAWAQDLFLLLELIQGKSPEAIEAVGRVMLPEDTVDAIESGVFTANARRLAYTMQVYYQTPSDLALLVLFEEAERAGYTRYVLVPQGGDGADYAVRRIQGGVDLATLTVSSVNHALQAFEGKRSTCARIVPESDGSLLVFIYRMLREASIPEMDRTLFGDEVETIVVRFRNRLQLVEERSAERTGVSIASAIAAHLLGAEVKYEADASRTTQKAWSGLLGALVNDKADRLRLTEVSLSHSPLEGSPNLVLRCDKTESLASTIKALDDRQISLLEEVQDVNYLGVAFDRVEGGKTNSYIFRLRVEPAGDSFFVHYSCGRLPTRLRNQFERYLRKQFDVTAIPTA